MKAFSSFQNPRGSFTYFLSAVGVWTVLATPIEYIKYRAGYQWRGEEAEVAVYLLNLGLFVPALFGPALLWLFTTPSGQRPARSLHSKPADRRPELIMVSLAITALSAAAWLLLIRGLWHSGAIRSPASPADWPPGPYYVQDIVRKGLNYYIWYACLSGLMGAVFCAEIRRRSLRMFSGVQTAHDRELRSIFLWNAVIASMVLFRLSEMIFVAFVAESDTQGLLQNTAIILVAILGCTIPAALLLWRVKPTSQVRAIVQASAMNIAVTLVVAAIFLSLTAWWLSLVIMLILLTTLNAGGFIWGITVGIWRWRSQELEKAIPTAKETHV